MRRTLAAAVGAVLALSLAACSEDDPEPEFAPPESNSPSTEPIATETAKQEPWEKNTRAGAVAFVKRWIAVFSDAQQSGDASQLRALSARDCVTCSQVSEHLEAIYAKGGFYESEGWRVQRATVGPGLGLPANVTKMLVRVLRTAERWQESATDDVRRNPPSTADYEIRVEWVDGEWVMERLVLLS